MDERHRSGEGGMWPGYITGQRSEWTGWPIRPLNHNPHPRAVTHTPYQIYTIHRYTKFEQIKYMLCTFFSGFHSFLSLWFGGGGVINCEVTVCFFFDNAWNKPIKFWLQHTAVNASTSFFIFSINTHETIRYIRFPKRGEERNGILTELACLKLHICVLFSEMHAIKSSNVPALHNHVQKSTRIETKLTFILSIQYFITRSQTFPGLLKVSLETWNIVDLTTNLIIQCHATVTCQCQTKIHIYA